MSKVMATYHCSVLKSKWLPKHSKNIYMTSGSLETRMEKCFTWNKNMCRICLFELWRCIKKFFVFLSPFLFKQVRKTQCFTVHFCRSGILTTEKASSCPFFHVYIFPDREERIRTSISNLIGTRVNLVPILPAECRSIKRHAWKSVSFHSRNYAPWFTFTPENLKSDTPYLQNRNSKIDYVMLLDDWSKEDKQTC